MKVGYSEAMLSAKVWKGRVMRWWDEAVAPKPLAGDALEERIAQMAGRFPDHVKVT